MGLFEDTINAAEGGSPSGVLTWVDPDGAVHVIAADCVTAFGQGLDAQPTEHPLSTGAIVSDHLIVRPRELTFQIVHSHSPITRGDGAEFESVDLDVDLTRKTEYSLSYLIQEGTAALADALFGKPPIKAILLQSENPSDDRIGTILNALDDVRAGGFPISLNIEGQFFEGYTLTSVRYTRNSEDSGLGTFDCAAVQLQYTESERVEGLTLAKQPTTPKMQKKKDNGAGAPGASASTGPASEDESKSLVAMGIDFLRGR